MTPAAGAIHGFLIAAPFVALALLSPAKLGATPTGRVLFGFAGAALLLYVGAIVAVHTWGLAGGGAEWGPRFLLPLYPALVAPAAAALQRASQLRRGPEVGLGVLLIVLGLAFQLAGLAQINHVLPQFREMGHLIDSLPPGPIVAGVDLPVRYSPQVIQRRAVFCAETPAALRRWAELALAAGEQEFWYVDFDQLPANWLVPGAARPTSLAERQDGPLRALRYQTAAVRASLPRGGRDRETCGARLLGL